MKVVVVGGWTSAKACQHTSLDTRANIGPSRHTFLTIGELRPEALRNKSGVSLDAVIEC